MRAAPCRRFLSAPPRALIAGARPSSASLRGSAPRRTGRYRQTRRLVASLLDALVRPGKKDSTARGLLRDWHRQDADTGSVTVEIAVALSALVLVTLAALWGVGLVSAQLTCTDAARLGARAAARGEQVEAVRAAVARAAPAGARVAVHRTESVTRVDVVVSIHSPARTGLGALTVKATAQAATEPGALIDPPEPRTGGP